MVTLLVEALEEVSMFKVAGKNVSGGGVPLFETVLELSRSWAFDEGVGSAKMLVGCRRCLLPESSLWRFLSC